jgi:hypothetical protein
MDSVHETNIDGIRVKIELEAEDTLAVRLKRVHVEGQAPKLPVRGVLERQTRTILEQVTYLDGPLSLIEIDGISNAVQIRSTTPEASAEGKRFVEVILRGGNLITAEARGGSVHLSKENFDKLIQTLKGLV